MSNIFPLLNLCVILALWIFNIFIYCRQKKNIALARDIRKMVFSCEELIKKSAIRTIELETRLHESYKLGEKNMLNQLTKEKKGK